MEARQIEAFRAVARHGGFARAARATGVGQPSLTRSVARLEAVTGFALFVRGQGAARLTPEGEAFLREVERRFVGLEQLRRVANDIRDFGTGRLRLAVLPAAASGLVPSALRRFVDRFPEVTIALHVRPSGTVYEWVATGHCDLGLAAPRSGFAGVEEDLLLDLAGVVAMPRGHRLARLRRALTPADLAAETFLAQGLEDPSRSITDAAFSAAGVHPRIRLETPFGGTLCAMVAAGLGVALVNPLVAQDHGALPVVFRPFEPRIAFRSYMLRQRGAVPDRLTAAFAESLRLEAGARADRAFAPIVADRADHRERGHRRTA